MADFLQLNQLQATPLLRSRIFGNFYISGDVGSGSVASRTHDHFR
jgi:hypothetical protein